MGSYKQQQKPECCFSCTYYLYIFIVFTAYIMPFSPLPFKIIAVCGQLKRLKVKDVHILHGNPSQLRSVTCHIWNHTALQATQHR